ncbi:MAG: choice-of-anchor X domain-containing protein, partial [Candidatus Poribacteria bacterium]
MRNEAKHKTILMMKKYNIILLIIFAVVFCIIASSAIAVTPPDTIIIAGPSKLIASSDVAFWWTGKVTTPDASGRLPSIKGFYYSLDSEPWNWTQDRFIVYYGLPKGDHFIYVKAVDSNDQEDLTPALRTFTIEQNALAESNEGQSLFTIPFLYINDLNTKVLLDNLRQEFLIRGIQLSTSAIIEVITKDSKWQIIDENLVPPSNGRSDKAYYIKKEVTDLSVYGVNNDTSSTAMVVPLNQKVQCQTFTAKDGADEDWFTVNVPKGTTTSPTPRQISIILNRPDAIVSSIVKIYRFPDISAGKEIASFEFKEKGFFATGIIPGDYFINIKPTASSIPSLYSLTMTADSLATEIIWDKEDNNGSNNATETSPIFLSKSFPWVEIVGNRLSTVDNKDWFSVHANLTERKRMSLNLTRPRSGSTTVRLYSASPMSLLGEFTVTPDSGSQWKLELGAGLGDYLIEVDLSKYDSTFSTVWETPYFLTLLISDFPAGEVWELEPNNSPDFADRLNLGERIKALRNQPSDIDWFRLTIPRNGILNLTASRILKNGSMNISLLDSAGQPLDKIKLQTGDQKGTLNINVSAGQYFVNTDFADFTGEYWLNAVLFTSVEHNVPPVTTLFIGNNLSVKLVWDKGNSASFDILYENSTKKLTIESIKMFDDGLHNDGNTNDGVYVGNYIIKEKDNAKDAIIVVHIKDKYDNLSDITITGKPILIDTTPPIISQVSHNAKEPLSIGDELIVTIKGEAGNKATFDVQNPPLSPFQKGETGQRLIGIEAYDDGKHNDGSANDGTYTGNYIIKGDDYIIDGIVTGYFADTAGNTASLLAVIKIDIVGDRPVINSVDHTGRLTLGKDEILTVTMIGTPEGIASFDIAGLKSNIPIYDDGKHVDGANGDGKYVGSYKVVEGDGVLSASLTAHLVDRKGKASSKVAQVKVNIDAVPPLPVTGVKCVDRPNDQGGYIIVTWKPVIEIDFANYTIYLSKDIPVPILKKPYDKSLIVAYVTDIKQTSIEIKIEENLADYYVAVTAVDIMGNESILDKSGGSVAGPVQAKDNLKPTPVKVVSAVDRDRDFGGFVIVSWTDSNIDEDFARYNIYQDIKPIISTQGLKPIDIITDRQLKIVDVSVESSLVPPSNGRTDTIDYYFAVTVVDLSDNESDLDKNSVAGPVKAENNIGTEPDRPLVFLSAPVGTIHHNNVAFHWNRFDYANDDKIKGYYIRLDSGNWQWTTDSDAVFYNLSAGDHKFSVRLPETMSAFTIERSFTIVPVTTSEQEPNNSIDKSSRLMTGVIVRGVGGDDDWYRIHVPPSFRRLGSPSGLTEEQTSSSPCIMVVLLS